METIGKLSVKRELSLHEADLMSDIKRYGVGERICVIAELQQTVGKTTERQHYVIGTKLPKSESPEYVALMNPLFVKPEEIVDSRDRLSYEVFKNIIAQLVETESRYWYKVTETLSPADIDNVIRTMRERPKHVHYQIVKTNKALLSQFTVNVIPFLDGQQLPAETINYEDLAFLLNSETEFDEEDVEFEKDMALLLNQEIETKFDEERSDDEIREFIGNLKYLQEGTDLPQFRKLVVNHSMIYMSLAKKYLMRFDDSREHANFIPEDGILETDEQEEAFTEFLERLSETPPTPKKKEEVVITPPPSPKKKEEEKPVIVITPTPTPEEQKPMITPPPTPKREEEEKPVIVTPKKEEPEKIVERTPVLTDVGILLPLEQFDFVKFEQRCMRTEAHNEPLLLLFNGTGEDPSQQKAIYAKRQTSIGEMVLVAYRQDIKRKVKIVLIDVGALHVISGHVEPLQGKTHSVRKVPNSTTGQTAKLRNFFTTWGLDPDVEETSLTEIVTELEPDKQQIANQVGKINQYYISYGKDDSSVRNSTQVVIPESVAQKVDAVAVIAEAPNEKQNQKGLVLLFQKGSENSFSLRGILTASQIVSQPL